MSLEASMAPDVHWRDAYAKVAEIAKAQLAILPAGEEISTNDLARRIYPGADKETKARIYKALKALSAHELVAYWHAGEIVQRMGKGIRPKLWHAPRATAGAVCPHCGHSL